MLTYFIDEGENVNEFNLLSISNHDRQFSERQHKTNREVSFTVRLYHY